MPTRPAAVISKASVANGWPIPAFTPGYVFRDYNIEQQAQMVQDRFLIRRGFLSAQTGTRDATLAQLNQVIPF
jgi:hypothetical protein